METWVDRQIARARKNLRIAAVIMVLAVLGTGAALHRYLLNYFQGPVAMTADELGKIKNPDDLARYWVTLTGDREADLGIYEETTTTRNGIETGKSNSAFYGVVRIGTFDLAVRDPHPIVEIDHPKLEGSLETFSKDEIASVQPLLKNDTDATALPFKIDTNNFKLGGNAGLAISGVVVLFALMLLFKSRRRASREDHPIVQQLAPFGDVHTQLMKLDAEIAPDDKARFGVTPTFAFWRTGFGTKIIPTADLIWSHVRTGRNPAVVHHLRNGKTVMQATPRTLGQQMLTQLAARAPWVFIGYDKAFVTGWAKDRANFIATADQRRAAAGTR